MENPYSLEDDEIRNIVNSKIESLKTKISINSESNISSLKSFCEFKDFNEFSEPFDKT